MSGFMQKLDLWVRANRVIAAGIGGIAVGVGICIMYHIWG